MAETIQPIYHNFDLGFDTEDIKRVSIKQDSDETHVLVITVYTNDDVMTLNPSWEYHITMRKPDGKLIVDTSNIEVKNNKIYVTCTAQMLSAPGTSKCELVIFNNSQSLYSNNFYIYVDKDLISGDELESTDEFNSLVDVLRLIQQYEAMARESKDNASTSEDAAHTSLLNSQDYESQIRAILDSLSGYDTEITELIEELENKSGEIEDLKQRVQDEADDINSLLRQLEDMGVDQLQQIVSDATALYNNIQDLNEQATADANDISTAKASADTMLDTIETKLNTVNTKYATFETQYADVTTKMNNIQTFIDNLDTIKTQIESDRDAIAASKNEAAADASAAASDYASIIAMKNEIEDIRNKLREEAQGGGGYDPIIIDVDQPDPDKQTTDDMWLEPYETDDNN